MKSPCPFGFFLCLAALLFITPDRSRGDAPAKLAPPPGLSPPPTLPSLGDLYRTLPSRAAPSPRLVPGDAIPPCYMVYGYGADAHGKGPFLDVHGNALPIGQEPRLTPVWRFQNTPQPPCPDHFHKK